MWIKRLGQVGGLLLGTTISPFADKFISTLEPFFNLQRAVSAPQMMVEEVLRFQAITRLDPDLVFLRLFPVLALFVLASIMLLALMSYLGGTVAVMVAAAIRSTEPAS